MHEANMELRHFKERLCREIEHTTKQENFYFAVKKIGLMKCVM